MNDIDRFRDDINLLWERRVVTEVTNGNSTDGYLLAKEIMMSIIDTYKSAIKKAHRQRDPDNL